ncbi:MAG TPA: winged helix-turn-helix domain-containing protein [Pyrinomonadaceae bacterium]|nr:winged helix-turn-helix domain-containing protein [Pyrinomonadaceae bacterium]
MCKHLSHIYEFDTFRLDPAERLLTRDGEAVPLTPKVFDTLLTLVRNQGHVVRKQDLMNLLWPDSFVEESSLTQNISLLRKALNGGPADRQYIETVPKLGYRFVPQVHTVCDEGDEVGAAEAATPPPAEPADVAEEARRHAAALSHALRPRRGAARRRFARPALLAACAMLVAAVAGLYLWRARGARDGGIEGVESVAVLPFKMVGGGGESELLGLGMADALILRLSSLERPRVLPTSAVYKYTGGAGDALSAGRELGVDAVLDGTVQRAGPRVRVTARLVRLRDGRALWAGTFDRSYEDIFALQDSISGQLAASLVPRVAAGAARNLPAKQLTKSTEAYELYLLGLNFWSKRTVDGLTKGMQYLGEAVNKDPDFALAHAILADCYYLNAIRRYNIVPTEESLDRARKATARALELDDTVAEAHTVMAGLKTFERDYAAAARAYDRALSLNPNYAVALVRFGHFCFAQGRLADALQGMRRARELDPLSPTTNGALSFMLLMSRDKGEALKYARRAYELEPDAFEHQTTLGEAYIANGMFDEGIRIFRGQAAQNPSLSRQFLIYAHLAAGRREEGRAMLEEFLRSPDSARAPRYNFAIFYALLGEKETAIGYVGQVLPNPYNLAMLRFDPQLDALRSDPRFDATLRRLEDKVRRDAPHAIRNQ